MRAIEIDDPSDERIADYVGLRDADLREEVEDRRGIFIAEGTNVIRRLFASPYRVRSVLVTPRKYERLSAELDPLDAPVYVASREVMAAVAGFDIHRGVVAAAERRADPGVVEVLRGARTVVVLEGLNDQENLGAIIRSARALDADALVLDPRCADPFYRRVIRVSMGELLFLPVTRLPSWPAGLDAIHSAGFAVAALTPGDDAVSLFDWRAPERVALLLGAEGPGLSAAALARADVRIRIPIRDDVDSLNVGHAAAVALAFVSSGRRGAVPGG
ncbi:MAG: TrmH family RNA methyltransferase [Acidimicrobiia bacterium]